LAEVEEKVLVSDNKKAAEGKAGKAVAETETADKIDVGVKDGVKKASKEDNDVLTWIGVVGLAEEANANATTTPVTRLRIKKHREKGDKNGRLSRSTSPARRCPAPPGTCL
jgi:hypothetical protein